MKNSHTATAATYEFRLILVVLAVMIALSVFIVSRASRPMRNQCITSLDAQVCGTQVTRP